MSVKLEQRTTQKLESLVRSLQEENRELRGHLCAKEKERASRCDPAAAAVVVTGMDQKQQTADSYSSIAKLRIQLETTKQELDVELQKKQMMCSYLNVMECASNNENAAPVRDSSGRGGSGQGEKDELLDFFQALSPVKCSK